MSTTKRVGKKTRRGPVSSSLKPPKSRTTNTEQELGDHDLDKVSGGTGSLLTDSPVTGSSSTSPSNTESWSHEYELRAGKWTSVDYEFDLPTKTSR